MLDVIAKVFGTSHERAIQRQRPRVARIDELEPTWRARSDAELRGRWATVGRSRRPRRPLDSRAAPTP